MWSREPSARGSSGRVFNLVPVVLPPCRVCRRQIGIVCPQPHGTVDVFPDDVGVADMTLGFRDHVDHDLLQGDVGAMLAPPWNSPGRVEIERCDCRVGTSQSGARSVVFLLIVGRSRVLPIGVQ